MGLFVFTYTTNQREKDNSTSGVQIEYGEVSVALETVLWHLEMGKLPKRQSDFTKLVLRVFELFQGIVAACFYCIDFEWGSSCLHTVHYQPTRKGQKSIGSADRIWRGIRSIGNCVVAFGDGKLPKRQSDFTKLVLRVFECLFIPWRFW